MFYDLIVNPVLAMPSWLSTTIGVLGFCLYLTNYTLVTFRIISSQGMAFFALNIGAAILVLISLVQNFNLGAMLIQIFWIALGMIAITIRLRGAGSQATSHGQVPAE